MNLKKCLLLGHKPTSMIVENDDYIYITGCERCGKGLSTPIWKKVPPPPNVTEEEWSSFQEDYHQRVREIHK